MRDIMIGCAALCLISVACGCASSPPQEEPGAGKAIDAPGDLQYDPSQYDGMFVTLHAGLVGEIISRGEQGGDDTLLEEIRSIVKTAEEFYLEGHTLLAIKLLTEAELLLRQFP